MIQCLADLDHDVAHLVERQQVGHLGIRDQVFAFQEFHGNEGEIMFLAGIENAHDVGMIQSASRFGLAEEAILGFLQFVAFKFGRECHRFDRHFAANLRIFAEIDHAHRALAQFFLHLIAAEHWLLAGAGNHHRRRTGTRGRRAAENNRLRHRFRTVHALGNIFEFGIVLIDESKRGFGFIKLAAALKIKCQRINVFQQLLIHRTFAEFVERHIELPLLLERQAQHTV